MPRSAVLIRNRRARDQRTHLQHPASAFARVTSLAALVIAGSGVVDLFAPSNGHLGSAWTWVWTLAAAGIAAIPAVLRERFPRWAALAGCYLFIVVTGIQMALSDKSIASANNLVLYPMLACYTGWFFRRSTARLTVGVAFTLAAVALVVNPFAGLATTWWNLGLASLFCLEAAGYLRRLLDHQVRTDPLTGAMNRTGLQERIEAELSRAARRPQTLLVVLLDLDDFKLVNDTHGHAAGDRLLTDVVASLRTVTRPYDLIARIGGDEFMVLLPSAEDLDIADLLRRLREHTGDIFSHGVARAFSQDSAESLTERADQQLYLNKAARKRT